jgi:hypothetical protein
MCLATSQLLSLIDQSPILTMLMYYKQLVEFGYFMIIKSWLSLDLNNLDGLTTPTLAPWQKPQFFKVSFKHIDIPSQD